MFRSILFVTIAIRSAVGSTLVRRENEKSMPDEKAHSDPVVEPHQRASAFLENEGEEEEEYLYESSDVPENNPDKGPNQNNPSNPAAGPVQCDSTANCCFRRRRGGCDASHTNCDDMGTDTPTSPSQCCNTENQGRPCDEGKWRARRRRRLGPTEMRFGTFCQAQLASLRGRSATTRCGHYKKWQNAQA